MFESPEFWVAISFFVTASLLARPLVKRIGGALDARNRQIAAELAQARGLREEAAELLASAQQRRAEAQAEAHAILAQAEDEARRIRQQAERDGAAAITRRQQQAVDKIARAEAEALGEVRKTAAEIAVAATKKLLVDAMDQTRGDRLIDAAIEELPRRLG